MNKRIAVTIFRWLFAIAFFCAAYWFLEGASHSGSDGAEIGRDSEAAGAMSGIHHVLLGMGAMIGGVVFISPELIRWGSMPLQFIFNSVFFPGESETPPPDYTLTRVYRDQERYQEAIEQYLLIIHNHPEELLAYIEGIETAFEGESPEEAQKIYRMGMRKLSADVAREQVHRAFETFSQAAREREEARQNAPEEDREEPDGEENSPQEAGTVELPRNDTAGQEEAR